MGPILNWLLQCFCRLFQNKPRHHHHSRRATSSSRHRPPGSPPSPDRAASHSLVCEQMDIVAVDAFAAFIIVYTLFIVVVLPINSFVEPLVSLSLDHSDKLVGLLTLWITRINSVALPLLLSSYQYVLHAIFTAHKTIILELVSILACIISAIGFGQKIAPLNSVSPSNQFDRERLAVSNLLNRFRFILDLDNLTSVVVYTDDILLNFELPELLNQSSSVVTG